MIKYQSFSLFVPVVHYHPDAAIATIYDCSVFQFGCRHRGLMQMMGKKTVEHAQRLDEVFADIRLSANVCPSSQLKSLNAWFKSTIGFWMAKKSWSLIFLNACSQSNARSRNASGNSRLEGCGRAKSPKMWYSLTGFSVLEIVTESLNLLSTCWYLGRFKGGNEASVDNASFGSLLSWFFRFSAGIEKGSVACLLGWRKWRFVLRFTDGRVEECLLGR